jgi:hypothetical protein
MSNPYESQDPHYHELSYYTLAHPDPAFLHQNIVDAYTAQNASESTKPIAVIYSLIGLYLHVEKNFTGKQVQRAHMKMAQTRRPWVSPPMPKERGAITVREVLAAPEGPSRDGMIHQWCASVWNAWGESRDQIADLAARELQVR